MDQNDRPRPRFSDQEGEDLMQYERVSRLAIASLALACISPAALLDPLLWTLPIAAAALALTSLRMIGAGESGLSGRKTAIGALAIALLFGGAASAHFFTRYEMLYCQARQFGQRWLELVLAGQLEQAHQLHLDYDEREKPGVSLKRHYAPRPEPPASHETRFRGVSPHSKLDAFFRNSILRTIVANRRSGRIEFQQNVRQQCLDGSWRVVQQFVFHYEKDGQPETLPFQAVSLRTLDPKKRVLHWVLDGVREIGQESL